MSAMTDTKDRQEGLDDNGKKAGKGVDFVDYFTAGVSLPPRRATTRASRPGTTCAARRSPSSAAPSRRPRQGPGEEVQGGRQEGITIEAFDNDAEAQTRLKAGGAVADLNDFPVAAYAAKTSGGGNDFEVVGEQIDAGPYGIAVAKDNTELRDALKDALDAIIKNGEYDKVLEKWGVEDGAVTEATINAGK